MAPENSAVNVAAIAAEDACIMTVITIPMTIKIALFTNESATNASNEIIFCAFAIPVCKKSIPKNKKPKPANTVPYVLYWRGAIICANTPMPTIGNENAAKLTLKPINEMIHPVLVLPMFAPIMTPIDCANVNNPALTKPIVKSVVAVDDCTSTVMTIPENSELIAPPVNLLSHFFSASPASSFNPFVSIVMPSKKIPMPPITAATYSPPYYVVQRFTVRKMLVYSSNLLCPCPVVGADIHMLILTNSLQIKTNKK